MTRKFSGWMVLLILLSLALAGCAGTPGPQKMVQTIEARPVESISPTPPALTIAAPTATTPPEPAQIYTVTPIEETPAVAPTETVVPLPTLTQVPAQPTPTLTRVPTTKAPGPTSPRNVPTATPAVKTSGAATPTPGPAQPTFTPVPTVAGTPYNGSLSEVGRGRSGKKQVALTLDAGSGSQPFPKLLNALSSAGVKITFFLTGQWASQNAPFVGQIVANGHEIANHSWSHADFTTISREKIREEMEKTDALMSKFTGKSTKPLMRFPYGSRNAALLGLVSEMGYRSIFWTIDSLDSVGQPKSAQFLIDRITKQSDAQLDGQIILMHIGNATTADALPAILQNLQSRGFQVVTVSELLK